jgi:hypothetical protein
VSLIIPVTLTRKSLKKEIREEDAEKHTMPTTYNGGNTASSTNVAENSGYLPEEN